MAIARRDAAGVRGRTVLQLAGGMDVGLGKA